MVWTVLLAFGFQGRSAPVSTLIAAAWLRATSPVPAASPDGRTDVKSPPRYAVDPLMTMVSTRPLVCHEASTGFDPATTPCAPATNTSVATSTAPRTDPRIRNILPPSSRKRPIQGYTHSRRMRG